MANSMNSRYPTSESAAADLTERLRRLPVPPAPEELESKLLAAIPARFGRTEVRSRSRRWPIAAGALAAAAAAYFLLWPLAHQTDQPTKTKTVAIKSSVPRSKFHQHDPQETDPCNIFPPLANWR
jgi:hypothetical protein